MVDRFDVDRCDVVGQQHDFVAMDFVFVLVWQLLRCDQAALHQPRDERACARKRVKDVDAFAAQRLAKFILQNVVDAVDDEVHYFHWRVDNAQPFCHLREGVAKELVVQFHHDLLLALGQVDAVGSAANRCVELLQRVGFLVQPVLLQQVEDSLHAFRDRVVAGEAVLSEQGVEDWFGDEVLGQHLDDFFV